MKRRLDTSEVTPRRVRRAPTEGWTIVAVSMYPRDLAALDAVRSRMRAAGVRRMSRSRLLRIAMVRMDEQAVTQFELESQKRERKSRDDQKLITTAYSTRVKP